MILGAGRGTRLASLKLNVPKVLVNIGDRTLLERQIDYLARERVERVVVNAHHLADTVEAFARNHKPPVTLRIVREPRLLGTAGGVRNALDVLGDDSFVVLYGDVIVDERLEPIVRAHRERGAVVTVTVYESDEVEGKGIVLVNADGWVTAFAEKTPNVPAPALVNAGLYIVEPSFIRELPPGSELDFGHDVFPAALSRVAGILAYRLSRPVIDVGTPTGLELARATLAARA